MILATKIQLFCISCTLCPPFIEKVFIHLVTVKEKHPHDDEEIDTHPLFLCICDTFRRLNPLLSHFPAGVATSLREKRQNCRNQSKYSITLHPEIKNNRQRGWRRTPRLAQAGRQHEGVGRTEPVGCRQAPLHHREAPCTCLLLQTLRPHRSQQIIDLRHVKISGSSLIYSDAYRAQTENGEGVSH